MGDETEDARALELAVAQYRTIAANFPNGMIALFDHDLRYQLVYGEGLRAAGLNPEDLTGKRLRDVFPPEVYERDEPALLAALRGERRDAFIDFGSSCFRVVTMPVKNEDGEVLGGMVMSQDVTTTKRTELELQRTLDKLTFALDSGRLGIWELDLATDELTWNAKQFEIMGVAADQPITRDTFFDLVHEDDRARTLDAMERITLGETVRDVEFRVVRSNGDVRHIAASGQPLLDDDGEVERTVGINIDVTKIKRAEEERERLDAHLRQTAKLEAIGQLTGGVAHDFNNLLQVILGQTEEAMQQLGAQSAVRESLEDVITAGHRAAELVRHLLAFSRKQVLRPEATDLDEVVRGMLKLIEPLIEPNIRIRFEPAGAPPVVHADRGSLEQVLMNLCLNARDAMPSGGQLEVKTRRITLTGAAANEADVPAGEYAELTVRDSGVGMDEATLRRVFDPFFTTKEVGKGTGLGLATVHGVVRQHRGAIFAQSHPGRGTVFTIHWPIADEVLRGEPPTPEPDTGRRGLVLVADDDDLVRRVTRRHLERAGFEVVTAIDGREAVELAEARGDALVVVLLDVMMPVMNGLEAYRRIREVRADLPVVFTSGYGALSGSGDEWSEAARLLPKPFDRQALLDAVDLAIADAGS